MITWLVILSIAVVLMIPCFIGLLLRMNEMQYRMNRMEYIISKEDGIAP